MLSTLASKKLSFSSVPYDVKAYGEITYLTVAKFLYSVHETHWKELPNINRFKGKMTLKDDYMEEVKAIFAVGENEQDMPTKEFEIQEITHDNYKHLCNDRTIGLCVIVFVDGNDERIKDASIQVLRDVHFKLKSEGRWLMGLFVGSPSYR